MPGVRYCGECRQPARQDDPMQVVQVQHDPLGPTRTFWACAGCTAVLCGLPPPAPRRHPPGCDRPFAVCGVCRLALCDGEAVTPMRLHADDVAGEDLRPGCYAACPRCVEKYRPAIARRLGRAVGATTGDWLL